MRTTYQLVGATSGLVLAALTEAAVRRLPPAARLPVYTAALPVAALVYPVVRKRGWAGGSGRRELAASAAYTTATALTTRASPHARSRLVAAGWVSHAAFDLLHHRDDGSLVPDWYPAACLTYDLAAAALVRHRAD